MERSTWRAPSKCALVFSLVAYFSTVAPCQKLSAETDSAAAGSPNTVEVLNRIDQLMAHNRQLEEQNQELMNQIESLRRVLALQADVAGMTREASPTARAAVSTSVQAPTP